MDLARGGEGETICFWNVGNPDGISSYKQRRERQRRSSQIKAPLPLIAQWRWSLTFPLCLDPCHCWGKRREIHSVGNFGREKVEQSQSERTGSLGSLVISFLIFNEATTILVVGVIYIQTVMVLSAIHAYGGRVENLLEWEAIDSAKEQKWSD